MGILRSMLLGDFMLCPLFSNFPKLPHHPYSQKIILLPILLREYEQAEENIHMFWPQNSPTCSQGEYTRFKQHLFSEHSQILNPSRKLSPELQTNTSGSLLTIHTWMCKRHSNFSVSKKTFQFHAKKRRGRFILPIPYVLNLAFILDVSFYLMLHILSINKPYLICLWDISRIYQVLLFIYTTQAYPTIISCI